MTAGAIAAPTLIPATALGQGGRPAPSNRITLGVIGVGGMGMGDMRALMHPDEIQVLAVCDVDQKFQDRGREGAKRMVEEFYGEKSRCRL